MVLLLPGEKERGWRGESELTHRGLALRTWRAHWARHAGTLSYPRFSDVTGHAFAADPAIKNSHQRQTPVICAP